MPTPPAKRAGAAAPTDDVSRETADVSRETSTPSGPAPTIGRIVHYRLSKQDAAEINRRRQRYADAPDQSWGFLAPVGNHAAAGQVFPADIVRVFGDSPKSAANLQVKLDGTDVLWVTSRTCGDEDGQWSWPGRA